MDGIKSDPRAEEGGGANPIKRLATMLEEAGAIPVICGVALTPERATAVEGAVTELKELALDEDYRPDSFTLQPLRNALLGRAAIPEPVAREWIDPQYCESIGLPANPPTPVVAPKPTQEADENGHDPVWKFDGKNYVCEVCGSIRISPLQPIAESEPAPKPTSSAKQEHPRADCEGCNKLDCPCNARDYEGEAAVAYSDGFIQGRETGYHHCGSCSHAWEGHDGECKAYMTDGSICGCRKMLVTHSEEASPSTPVSGGQEFEELTKGFEQLFKIAEAIELADIRGERQDEWNLRQYRVESRPSAILSLRDIIRALTRDAK